MSIAVGDGLPAKRCCSIHGLQRRRNLCSAGQGCIAGAPARRHAHCRSPPQRVEFPREVGRPFTCRLAGPFPAGTVFLMVVDTCIGTDRDAVILQADGKGYVGPDNGLLSLIAARATETQALRVVWHPTMSSTSFHGRDILAPPRSRLSRTTCRARPQRRCVAAIVGLLATQMGTARSCRAKHHPALD